MPITCPELLTSAPPLLPGSMGALVWIAPGSVTAAPLWPVGARRGRLGDRAISRGDDSLGDAAGQAKRVADGQHHIASHARVRVAERGRLQPGGIVGADHREIVGRVRADQPRRARGGAHHGHLDTELRGAPRDVGVGNNVPRPVKHHSGAEPVGRPDQHHRGQHLADYARVAGGARRATRDGGARRGRRRAAGGSGSGDGRADRDAAAADHHRRHRGQGRPGGHVVSFSSVDLLHHSPGGRAWPARSVSAKPGALQAR